MREMWREREVWNKEFFNKEWVLFCRETCAEQQTAYLTGPRELADVPPTPPPTPNKPLLFFFLKHEFPSYTTHAPLPFSCSLTTCISPLSYPSRSSCPSSLFLACFPFFVVIMELSFSTWLTSSPSKARQEEKESNAFSESTSPSQ